MERFAKEPSTLADLSEESIPRSSRWAYLVLFLIPLALSAAVFFAIGIQRPEYLRDFRLNANPDAVHYVILGKNLLLNGHFSRVEHPPFFPDMIRTPVYPIFSGGLEIAGGPLAIYLTQAVLHATACVLLFVTVRRHLGTVAAWASSLLLGTDLMLIVSDFEAMAEPLFVFWMVLASYFLLGAIAPRAQGRTTKLLAAGVVMGLAIMTRPAGLYMVCIYCLFYLYFGFRERRFTVAVLQVLILTSVTAIPVGCWIARNNRVFSIPKLSYGDDIVLTFFVAAGAYQVEHGVSAAEAQEMIIQEFHLPSFIEVHNEWVSNKSIKEIDDQMKAAWPRAVFKYPKSLVIASLIAIAKASVSHNVALLAELTDDRWISPGMGDLSRLRPGALRRLSENGFWLTTAFAWEMLHTAVSLIFLIPGLLAALKNAKTRPMGLTVGAILVYFYLTVALFGPEAFYRSRSPLLPFLDMFAGYGIVRFLFLVRSRFGVWTKPRPVSA